MTSRSASLSTDHRDQAGEREARGAAQLPGVVRADAVEAAQRAVKMNVRGMHDPHGLPPGDRRMTAPATLPAGRQQGTVIAEGRLRTFG